MDVVSAPADVHFFKVAAKVYAINTLQNPKYSAKDVRSGQGG